MAVSPLERDTTLKAQQQNSFSSSTASPINAITHNLRPPIIIRRGPRSFGFTLRAVKVFHGNTDYYTTQHVIVAVEGPAQEAGLRPDDVITHVNERPVSGLPHPEVVKLILSGSPKLSIRAVPSSETQIRTGGRRRSPSKQKFRYQNQPQEKKTPSTTPYHQPHCQKHRLNSTGNAASVTGANGNGNNANKKNPQNASLFRRLSERKVARDMEAAAAAAAGVSLTIPSMLPAHTHMINPLTRPMLMPCRPLYPCCCSISPPMSIILIRRGRLPLSLNTLPSAIIIVKPIFSILRNGRPFKHRSNHRRPPAANLTHPNRLFFLRSSDRNLRFVS